MGTPGEDGTDGMNGTNGAPGANGVHCWDLNGNGTCDLAMEDTDDDNACDVADCAGPPGADGANGAPGTTGQAATSVFGNSTLLLAANAAATNIPGLEQTVTVPANAITFIASDGGLFTNGTLTTDFNIVDIAITIDNAILTNGGYQQLVAANSAGVTGAATWGFSVATPLTAGTHTIRVVAVGKGTAATPTATISGGTGNVRQGTLTVMFLKQ
ncbi:MAG: hypothetical protein AB7T06_07860 [Kofleriaceae bacterium]